MKIPIFRAKKLGTENEYVEGFLKNCTDTGLDIFWIQDKDFIDYRIDIDTLSISFPDILDNQGNEIFASLQEDGKGGDIVEEYVGDEAYRGTVFIQNGCMELRTDYNGKAKTLIDYAYINEDLGYKGVKIIGIQQ